MPQHGFAAYIHVNFYFKFKPFSLSHILAKEPGRGVGCRQCFSSLFRGMLQVPPTEINVLPLQHFKFIALGEDAYQSRSKEAHFRFRPEVWGPSVTVVFARASTLVGESFGTTSFTILSPVAAIGFLTIGTPLMETRRGAQ